jgi:hypothetical protein
MMVCARKSARPTLEVSKLAVAPFRTQFAESLSEEGLVIEHDNSSVESARHAGSKYIKRA